MSIIVGKRDFVKKLVVSLSALFFIPTKLFLSNGQATEDTSQKKQGRPITIVRKSDIEDTVFDHSKDIVMRVVLYRNRYGHDVWRFVIVSSPKDMSMSGEGMRRYVIDLCKRNSWMNRKYGRFLIK